MMVAKHYSKPKWHDCAVEGVVQNDNGKRKLAQRVSYPKNPSFSCFIHNKLEFMHNEPSFIHVSNEPSQFFPG
jgi:hypothetical protein